VDIGECRVLDEQGEIWIKDVAWSPCSTWIAFSRGLSWWRTELCVASVATREVQSVSGREFISCAPSWDPAGRFLAFLSTRELEPFRCEVEHLFSFPASTRAYAVMLRANEEVPFAPEVTIPEEPPARVTEPVAIDFDGLAGRTVALPFDRGRLSAVACTSEAIAVLRAPISGMC
jgi:tricorn protease